MIHYADGFEDTPIVLMDRVQGIDGTAIVQSDITAITYVVHEYATQAEAEADTDGTAVGSEGTLTVSDVVYDTLQTAAPWTSSRDATGYNFRFTLPAARRPTGGKWYRVEVTFDPAGAGEEDFVVVWVIEAKALAGS